MELNYFEQNRKLCRSGNNNWANWWQTNVGVMSHAVYCYLYCWHSSLLGIMCNDNSLSDGCTGPIFSIEFVHCKSTRSVCNRWSRRNPHVMDRVVLWCFSQQGAWARTLWYLMSSFAPSQLRRNANYNCDLNQDLMKDISSHKSNDWFMCYVKFIFCFFMSSFREYK